MAMQSHHLHTHGPQPLYKQITDEEYEALNNENHALKQANKNLEERVTELEHQLARFTWHSMDKDTAPVDEYLICYGGDDWNGKGYSMLKATEDKDEIGNPIWTDGSGASICIDEITHWMYMPPEPPEDAEPDGELSKSKYYVVCHLCGFRKWCTTDKNHKPICLACKTYGVNPRFTKDKCR